MEGNGVTSGISQMEQLGLLGMLVEENISPMDGKEGFK
jgi:hypothetical protein